MIATLNSFHITLIILGGLIIILLLLALIGAIFINQSMFNHRIENPEHLKYFNIEDYPQLKSQEINFKGNKNQNLKGNLYYFDHPKYLGIIVVSHGIGGGHLAYMTEIVHFARLGFKVISYDNTGTAASEGKKIVGLPQAIIDLDCLLSYLAQQEQFKNQKVILYGHSMGGYAVINGSYLHPSVAKVVALAPVDSYLSLLKQNLKAKSGKKLRLLVFFVKIIEKIKFKQFASMSSYQVLLTTKIPTLVVQGDLDPVFNFHDFQKMVNNNNNPNVCFVIAKNKRHRPNISDQATTYDIQVEVLYEKLKRQFKTIPLEEKEKFKNSLDYQLLVEFDDQVIESIDQFILSNRG